MKRFIFVIIPVVGLLIFSFFYVQHLDTLKIKEEQKKAAKVEAERQENERKAIAAQKAQEDAIRRQQERDAEEEKRRKEKEQKHLDAVAGVQKQIDEHKADTAKYLQQTKDNETKLAKLRDEREALRRESYDLSKQVALSQIERRNAELEIQRFADMVVNKADQSVLAKIPTPAPAK